MASIYCYKYAEPKLNLLGVVDDFVSFNFTRSYSGIGEWQLVLNGSSLNASRIKGMDFISLGQNVAGFVQHYEDTINDGVHTVTYTGIELKGLAERRIVIPASGEAYQHYYNKEPEYIIAELLDKQIINPTDTSRRIYGSIAPYTSYHSGITYDGRYQVLSEEIIELATAYDIGWCASIEDSTIVWKIWNGVDRTAGQTENNRMMLDYGYGTMNNSTLTVENTVPTFMIVAGQGEGADRSIEELNNGATGLSRIETFLDARDIEDDTLLPQRGQEKLAEYGDNSSYNATLSNQAIQQYRTEFDLGDIGTIRDEKLDGSLDYRITSIEEVYEEHQIMINVVFGYDKNTLKDSIQRMNSKRDALLAVESYSGGGSTGGGCDCEPLTITDDGAGLVTLKGGSDITEVSQANTISMKSLKLFNDDTLYNIVDGDAVHISAQTLSDIEKTQVLNNIGAAAVGHSHTPAAIGAAEADHTHITSEVSYNTTKITVDIDPSPIQTGVSIQQVDGTGKTTGYPINYGAMVAFKGGVNRGFILAGGKGDGQQMYVRGLTTGTEELDWSKIYTSIDVRCQDTAPTANLAKGQLWLKPI